MRSPTFNLYYLVTSSMSLNELYHTHLFKKIDWSDHLVYFHTFCVSSVCLVFRRKPSGRLCGWWKKDRLLLLQFDTQFAWPIFSLLQTSSFAQYPQQPNRPKTKEKLRTPRFSQFAGLYLKYNWIFSSSLWLANFIIFLFIWHPNEISSWISATTTQMHIWQQKKNL